MSKPTIGFIGLGLMGGAMVGRLQDQGYDLVVIANRTRTYVDRAVERGAVEVTSAKAVAEGSDIVMLCMDTSDNVEARMRGPEGVIAGLKPGAVVIDFGTSLPASTKALGAEVASVGGTMLDCPIGRTPMHAKDGLLNLMGSGDKAAFDRVKPVLDDLGENVFHLGVLGTGHTIKLINNFYAQACANAMAESYAIADVMGVDRQGLYDVMSAGPLKSGMMDFVTAYALQGDDQQLAFSIKNAAKDVGYYAQMCSDAGVQSMMSGSTLDSLRGSIDAGRGEEMVPLQVDFFADRFKG
ncbi:NAD(P)-dependent oxidoreductase [Tateyamaria omphalii]|uniref:NAD(P)-dependent oxidoreductase n=1 Tax=Tateyamaria omphalii TaxID=299262 RepID=UPI001C99BA9C|nr:NAD(P)-dependent oxidoreductase [Tateyamaria omphalii]MBY5933698.1 NAD(P)-dependent oxidoreductase [Tateyamaria omphalii]